MVFGINCCEDDNGKDKSTMIGFQEFSYPKLSRRLSIKSVNLLKENQIPPHMREVAILSGYRSPKCSALQCALSVFMATNETFNFWTHFIPTLYFVWQLVMFWDLLRVISDPYTWPFTAYMFSVCLYPFVSALAHTFFSISDTARHVWFFLDYGALNFYGFGAGLLYKSYVFPEELRHSLFGEYFLHVLVFLCISGTVMACWSRFISNTAVVKTMRLGAFALSWTWDSIPLVYRLMYSSDLKLTATEHYLFQFFFSFLIGFFYASHLPERLAPGKFDILGNSHQLLHICGILATHHQMCGALIDMEQRREMLLAHNAVLSEFWSINVFLFMFFSIVFIIAIFVYIARKYESKQAKKKFAKTAKFDQ